MFPRRNLPWFAHSLLLICLLLVRPALFAQNPQEPKPSDDVVRVFTELVQTDVMVFDKQGRFVDGLTQDKFEIKIDLAEPVSHDADDRSAVLFRRFPLISRTLMQVRSGLPRRVRRGRRS